jgi:hypothetical protein
MNLYLLVTTLICAAQLSYTADMAQLEYLVQQGEPAELVAYISHDRDAIRKKEDEEFNQKISHEATQLGNLARKIQQGKAGEQNPWAHLMFGTHDNIKLHALVKLGRVRLMTAYLNPRPIPSRYNLFFHITPTTEQTELADNYTRVHEMQNILRRRFYCYRYYQSQLPYISMVDKAIKGKFPINVLDIIGTFAQENPVPFQEFNRQHNTLCTISTLGYDKSDYREHAACRASCKLDRHGIGGFDFMFYESSKDPFQRALDMVSPAVPDYPTQDEVHNTLND